MNIVLIENDAPLLRTLEIILSNRGDTVLAFGEPNAACRFVEEGGRVDVLVLDYMISGHAAPEILQRMRTHLPSTSKIILMSGHTDVLEDLDLGSMGVHAFLAKPVDLDQFIGEVSAPLF